MSGGFLGEITARVREDVARSDYLAGLGPPPTARPSLRRAVERDQRRGALLVEYKRISPGRADERLPDRTPEAFLAATRGADVTGYSCLATRARFDGGPELVRALARGTDRPVLFKDFVVDVRQLDAAARAGAAAVLLIARLAERGAVDLHALAGGAHARGLEVLLELHASAELSRADGVPADVYGVNVRDLDTLELRPAVAERTLAAARAAGLRPVLGMSGIESPRDAQRLWDAGADGLLVGTAAARADDPARFLTSLRRGPGRSP